MKTSINARLHKKFDWQIENQFFTESQETRVHIHISENWNASL